MPILKTTVSTDLARRVAQAARRIDQPVAAYVRMALTEKLDRDSSGR